MGLQRLQPHPELFPWALLSGAELAAAPWKGFAQVVFHVAGWEELGEGSKDRTGKLGKEFSWE